MRTFEFLLAITSSIGLCIGLIRTKPMGITQIILGGTLVILAVQLMAEGFRWQTAPMYCSIAILAFLILKRSIKQASIDSSPWISGFLKISYTIIIIITTVGLSFLLPSIFPVFTIEDPVGDLKVGTSYLHFSDKSRPEIFTRDANDFRRVYAQVWYPTEEEVGKKAQYLENPSQSLKMVTDLFRLPTGFFEQLSFITTNASVDVPVSSTRSTFPVLIYQHGYSFWMTQNTYLMEYLASKGFIVFSLAHPYETCYGISEAGDLITYDFENPVLQKRWDEIIGKEEISDLIGKIMDTENLEESRMYEKELQSLSPHMSESVRIWSDDATFLIDKLELVNKNKDHLLGGKMDLQKIGALGMSFGGAATAQLIISDDRVKAGINMDGGTQGDLIRNPLQKPFLFMISGNHGYLNNVHYQQSKAECYIVSIDGAKHLDFCDLNIISPVFFQQIGLMGTIDKNRMIKILNNYCNTFFNKYLLDLGEFPPKYKEANVQSRNLTVNPVTNKHELEYKKYNFSCLSTVW